ncbi:SMI1/KNR4 family protein [Kitasatospora xanthocidica]|uniref:SMI1/KNR4 family protein n=1 Tax=Kitasatospora xanthocidica TaxID=83382 RepID=UPI0016749A0F|nr:SMI1/KNR4 family protein [Kitasatospora xanthocidica]
MNWGDVESALGTSLPASYKSHSEMFGWGEFGNFIEVFSASLEPESGSIVGECRRRQDWADVDDEFASMYAPFELFPSPSGLLIWGAMERGGSLFWETSGEDPNKWPIVAVTEDDRKFSYQMEVSEFIFKCISGGVGPFFVRGEVRSFTPIYSYE